MKEIWKPIFEGRYLASNRGRIKPTVYRVPAKQGSVLRQSTKASGYKQVTLCSPGGRFSRLVHRCVAEAFFGPCPPGYTVNHKDGIKGHNTDRNLEYITQKANEEHAQKTGLKAHGARHGMARITEAQAARIKKQLAAGHPRAVIAEAVGASLATVHQIAGGYTWRHLK